jgi:hypothetical protein
MKELAHFPVPFFMFFIQKMGLLLYTENGVVADLDEDLPGDLSTCAAGDDLP